ncbi:DUF4249 domain-containing protein [Rufibacter sp. LB8]|uniref:DUF4249 domain-containing protein n=1 Tax=Rufibacter sp. LB8 TaxID=2777781 RepID=UPI00178C786B|nr:DUF4249 domain-containing protein [Rufibacter sp. LB8]
MASVISIRLRKCLVWLLVGLCACVEQYTPDVEDVTTNYLVVDGFINSQGATTIKLSRTQPISQEENAAVERGATVQVQELDGPSHALAEVAGGTYKGAAGVINPAKKYRLYLKTSAGKEYASDYVPVMVTPPIDAVTWKVELDGVQIYVSTHDDQQNTRYYRWDFEETFQFSSAFYSQMVFQNNQLTYRKDNIFMCWRDAAPGLFYLGSSVKLAQDVIHEAALVKLNSSNFKLKHRYSILVKQYAQTKEAFAYWEKLKKNTQDIGSLYDPLPTVLTGNVQSLSDPKETVIGYVSATSVQEKRIFIDRSQLPATWQFEDEYSNCRGAVDSTYLGSMNMAIGADSEQSEIRLLGPIIKQGFLVGAYFYRADCVDCRFRGTNIKPAFWED